MYERHGARLLFRRPWTIAADPPLISFTFDDFPQSALRVGGAILRRASFTGTYYVSLGLAGSQEPSGAMFLESDLVELLRQGHELGCHTFSHCHSWTTAPAVFEDSILANRHALKRLFPQADFQSFSYPISSPRPLTKAKVARYFLSARGGGQTFNAGTVDLNQLAAFFLEKSRDDLGAVRDVIDRNRKARGWLIFATHDISATPTPFGCTPEFFERVVRCAADSGARIVPVAQALAQLGVSSCTA